MMRRRNQENRMKAPAGKLAAWPVAHYHLHSQQAMREYLYHLPLAIEVAVGAAAATAAVAAATTAAAAAAVAAAAAATAVAAAEAAAAGEIRWDTPTFGLQPSRRRVPFVCPVCPAEILSNLCAGTSRDPPPNRPLDTSWDRYDWTTGAPHDGNEFMPILKDLKAKGLLAFQGRRGITSVVHWNLRPVRMTCPPPQNS